MSDFQPNTIEPKLALERMEAFANGMQAARDGKTLDANPYIGNLLRASQQREWIAGWNYQNRPRISP